MNLGLLNFNMQTHHRGILLKMLIQKKKILVQYQVRPEINRLLDDANAPRPPTAVYLAARRDHCQVPARFSYTINEGHSFWFLIW